jgi:hypothetical protein
MKRSKDWAALWEIIRRCWQGRQITIRIPARPPFFDYLMMKKK